MLKYDQTYFKISRRTLCKIFEVCLVIFQYNAWKG